MARIHASGTPSPPVHRLAPGTAALPLIATLFLACVATGPARADADSSATAAAPPTAARVEASTITDLGLENVQVDSAGGGAVVGFENRRYRHTVDALGHIERAAGGRVLAFERRLGLTTAAVSIEGPVDSPRFRIAYPSDPDFPPAPRGAESEPTRASIDAVLRPLFSYELGRLIAPIQVQFQLEPFLRYGPWPGARATASLVIPVYNDFLVDALHPDVDNVRPGLLTLEQFAWIPRMALVSGTAGLFADNRYGVSFGAARPLANGAFLLDAQTDVTGFVAFETEGLSYSEASQVSAFGGVTWFVPRYDVALRLRAGRFLYGDKGAHLELRRSFGDFEISLFGLRSHGLNVEGVRVSLPVPPMTRSTQSPVRMIPIERFPLSYRTDATPVGIFVQGVASREDYLRQLNGPALDANGYRYRRALGLPGPEKKSGPVAWVNASGMTGFIFTPWAGVLPEGTVSLDYTHVPSKWSYSGRGEFVNQAWSMAVGLLPRTEVSLRFTRLPGAKGFDPSDPDNLISTDTDHMASGRLVLLTPTRTRPGLAIGAEDIEGTRRFHSAYLVAGMPFEISCVQSRFSFGYASRVFKAARHVLDGGFGAIEISPWRAVATRVEYDSEKWNVGIGVELPFGFGLRAAALNLETLSAGVGWTHEL